jgi:signal transduction histidine kinase/ActR/RegA family two-component response regulator
MTQFTSLRARLVGTVFVALVPAWVVMYLFAYDPPWVRFGAGILALIAAWLGGEHFILRQVRTILRTTRLLASGDLTARTGLDFETGELGDLARDIDKMAATLQQKAREREAAEKILMSKALQQTVISVLGQFALVSKDFGAFLNHASVMVSQTLEVEYAGVFELQKDGDSLALRASFGLPSEEMAGLGVRNDPSMLPGYALRSGEPIVVEDFQKENRFLPDAYLKRFGARSGVAVSISGQGSAFGVLVAHTTNRRLFREDEVQFLLAVATVIAMGVARHRAEAELENLAAFAQLNPNPAMELDASGALTYSNDAAQQLAASFARESPKALLPPDWQTMLTDCLATSRPLVGLEAIVDRRTLSWAFHPVPASGAVHVYFDEITERLNLEAQLRQSQKMECVGQLAAGVAHDFNNMLTIIQGHSGLLLVKPSLADELRDGIQQVYFAAERAAALTRQLLMFSRKNVIQPRELNLGEIILTTSKLLERLLGESVRLVIAVPPNLPAARGDAGMIEQVLMNLAVNARDAMPRGGTLTIRAAAEEIEPGYVHSHPDARPGHFVRISVEDTGCGIDLATLPHIFEPFFTTKEIGKGTGLGLATVYGIIKQHEGWIDVQSEVARGTAFNVYFPAQSGFVITTPVVGRTPAEMQRGEETILLVEDEFVLRELARSILRDCGYRVIDAPSGVEALKIWEKEMDSVDLVLTDMVMPDGVSGMDLANRIAASKPGIRIIFASGYSMDDLDTEFLRKGFAAFLQKPYTHVTLSKAVRECLDSPACLEECGRELRV